MWSVLAKKDRGVKGVGTVWAVELLEYLAQRVGCAYLSDLRYLSPWEQMRLSREIAKVPAETFPLKMWNDALAYLTGLLPKADVSNAKEALLEHLVSWPSGAHCPSWERQTDTTYV